jgi:hypothetical protein
MPKLLDRAKSIENQLVSRFRKALAHYRIFCCRYQVPEMRQFAVKWRI